MGDESLRTTLLDLERRGWDALCTSTGGEFYGELMTEDALMVLANGMVLDRVSVVASLGEAPPWSRYEIGDERIVVTGSDSATLVYVATAWRDADPEPFVAAMSSVYRLDDDVWRLCLYQQTPVPAAGDR
ncbi:nuclear transport factor 2 family protein [Nocardioides sp. SYSU DS0663]|uniref:nuclear transport factor 2 family protein n=1 Tax=Nocardioides sp. SYSU DS0663 TaxID=3416445 RepID=UPI003F4BDF00